MKKILWALWLFAGGASTGWALAHWQTTSAPSKVLLENDRVVVSEYNCAPKAQLMSYARETDQLSIFLEDAEYDATDAKGQTQHKLRKRGEIVWHDKGEISPTLRNTSKKPFRHLIIALK